MTDETLLHKLEEFPAEVVEAIRHTLETHVEEPVVAAVHAVETHAVEPVVNIVHTAVADIESLPADAAKVFYVVLTDIHTALTETSVTLGLAHLVEIIDKVKAKL